MSAVDYNQIYGVESSQQQKGPKPIDPHRTIYWVIISKNKNADKFFIGPYMCVCAHTLIMVAEGECHCRCGQIFDFIHNPVNLDLCYHFPTKKVEDIVIGDNVLSYNEKTGKKEWDKVIDTSNMFSDEIMTIKLSNGNRLKCTPNHPFYIHNKGWVKAEDLTIGDGAIQLDYSGLSNRLKHLGKQGWSKGRNRQNDERINKIAYLKEGKTRPDVVERNTTRNPMLKEEARQKVSASIQYKFDNDPEYVSKFKDGRKKWHKTIHQFPNTSEIRMIDILKEACPGEWEYNGDGRLGLTMDNMNPDFVNVNGKKKVIELFGEYFHPAEDETIRKERFRKIGWECLVIWEKEMKEIENVKKRVLDFIYNPNTEIVTVISVERTRKNTRVYDISTEKNHDFFAYGILVHNTKEGAMNRKMNSSGYVVVYPTTEKDAQKVRVEYEQMHEMGD